MEEMSSKKEYLITSNPFKKAWQSFSSQNIKVKISLLTLLVAVITIPSLTAFVDNTSNTENIASHADELSPTPPASFPRYYSVVSGWETASPNEPSTALITCNTGDMAVSGGLSSVSGNTLNNWVTVRSFQSGFTQDPSSGVQSTSNMWTLTVLYTGTTAQQYMGRVLCLKNENTPSITPAPTCTPKPVTTCNSEGCMPTPPPGGWCTTSPTPTPALGLAVSPSSVNVTIPEGQTVKVLSIFSTGATQFEFKGYPTSYGPGINWTAESGGITPNRTIFQSIQVSSTAPVGTYTGTGVLVNPLTNAQTSFPVSVTVTNTNANVIH